MVASVNHQINLRAIFNRCTSPGGGGAVNATDSKGIFDLRQMTKTNLFECIAAPCPVFWIVDCVDPLISILWLAVFQEFNPTCS